MRLPSEQPVHRRQFTGAAFSGVLIKKGIVISKDGKG